MAINRRQFEQNTFEWTQWPTIVLRKKSQPERGLDKYRLYLDTKDIIDDDVELLIQLRRQMENNFNTSPREVTNRIKDFFASNQKSSDNIAVFRSYLESSKAVLDVVNVIMLLESCMRNRRNVLDFLPWPIILGAMERSSPIFTSSMVYRGMSCVKSLDLQNPNARRFLKLFWQRIEESGVLLSQIDLCPALYSMQMLNKNTPLIKTFMLYFATSLAAVTTPMPAKTVCSAIYGLRKQSASPEVRLLLWELANHIESSNTYFHSVNVCIALNGFQNMEDHYPEVRRLINVLLDKAIDADEQGIDKATDREISMALFGEYFTCLLSK